MQPINFAVMQHYENVEKAIKYLIDLYYDDVDIEDLEVFNAVLKRYGLYEDGFESEVEYIIQEVTKRIKKGV